MTVDKVDFTGIARKSVAWTMLCTLYLRAYESHAEHSILADHAAAEAVDRIEYDFDRMRRDVRPAGGQYIVALRARQLDEWAAAFLDRHPDAVVFHLGCGLDSRAFRLSVPPRNEVCWFDVDVREVPADRPALIIAQGLLMYLTEDQVRQLLQRLTDRFPTGELLFDGLAPWIVAAGRRLFRWATRDPRELERWNPRLRYLEETSGLSQFARIPVRSYRALFHLCSAIPGVRDYNRYFRFAF